MTAATLNTYSLKDLAQMAKTRGVRGWHSMRKEQLVRALVQSARRKAAKSKITAQAASRRAAAPPAAPTRRKAVAIVPQTPRRKAVAIGSEPLSRKAVAIRSEPPSHKAVAIRSEPSSHKAVAIRSEPSSHKAVAIRSEPPRKAKNPVALRRLQQAKTKLDTSKSLATTNGKAHIQPQIKDRLVAMVRGPFWLHAWWELTRQGVERAQAAMGQEWHAAKPTLRVLEVSGGATTSSAESLLRDIDIHGGVNNWYIDVNDPPKSYRLDIGYRAPSGKFFVLARSNVVSTPKAGSSDAIDENWTEVAENFEKIYAMSGGYAPEGPNLELQQLFEERLRRPMGSPMVTRFGAGAEGLLPKKRAFSFDVDAELIVYGVTEPDAHVTLQGDPVKLRPDGTFTVRFSLPNCRQVIPAVACSRDGFEQRTVVLAVERNTKTMEPLIRDGNE